MQNQLYTTPEAARLTEIPESTIRSWLSRHPGLFQVDVHIVIDEHGQKLWTEAGVALLRSRRGASKNATVDDADFNAQIDSTDLIEALLEESATQLARQFWQQLPGRVLGRIRQMRDNPTDEDRQIVGASVRATVNGAERLLLPTYQPMLLEGGEDETE